MIAGGITLGVWGGFKKRIVTSLSGIILTSFSILAIAAAPPTAFWMVVVAMAFMGFMMPMVNGPIHALFQSVVEPDMQGRVMSLISSVAQAMMPIGFILAGPITDATSFQAWFWVAGILNLIIGISGFFISAVINIESNRKAHHTRDNEEQTPASETPITDYSN